MSTLSSESEKAIGLNDLKAGDILLYELSQDIPFKKPFKDNLNENFGILIDKLICFAEKQNYTHAALIDENGKVVEATLPYLLVRDMYLEEVYNIHVRRMNADKDASKVLKYLPQTEEEIQKNPESYAMIMAVLAGLNCLLRTRLKDVYDKNTFCTIARCLLFFVADYLDKNKLPFSSGDDNWFCSQLVTYCYDMAAVRENDPAYKLKVSTNLETADTLLDLLINRFQSDDNLTQSKLEKPKEFEKVFKLADDFFKKENSKAKAGKQLKLNEDKILSKHLPSLNGLLKHIFDSLFIDELSIDKKLIKFFSAFIMPADLVDCLDNKYILKDMNNSENEVQG